MPAVEESIIIERSPEAVFRFTTDPRNVPRYSRNIVGYEKLEKGPLQVGARVSGTVRVAGRRIDFVYEVIQFDPPEHFVSKTVESPIPFRVTQHYEPTANGTRLDWLTESDGFGGFFGRLTESVVVSMYAGDLRSDLETLKRLIESDTA
ncbi:MAG TPA: SRPBCC family protein [Acidimicrobiia bacterium]|nr:SRPBCC family protein [Acidimicrobiia bacterium]